MKLFNSEQIREWDETSINEKWRNSLALMDHAAKVFFDWLISKTDKYGHPYTIIAGPGNNGGDAIVVAGLLAKAGKKSHLIRIGKGSGQFSTDNQKQFEKLKNGVYKDLEISEVFEGNEIPLIPDNQIIVDGIFGSGLNKPLEGWWAELINAINATRAHIYSIDIPSGMPSENKINGPCAKALATLSFEIPKLSFFFPENDDYSGNWEYRSIGLSENFHESTPSVYQLISRDMIKSLIKPRARFSHKGTYGHALLICGSAGKMGAAILAARAALRSGLGLLSIHLPCKGEQVMQTAVPEAMVMTDPHEYHWSTPVDPTDYNAIGIGSGIGTPDVTKKAFLSQIEMSDQPLVLDADALNILSSKSNALELIPRGSVLTPHPGEFKRLFGDFDDTPSRWKFMLSESGRTGVTIILKGAHTTISTPRGNLYINSSGNPGMATAGSGDTLTGMITSLISQGYSGEEAALIGVYWHGLAGDIAAQKLGYESLIASDIIENLGPAFQRLYRGKA